MRHYHTVLDKFKSLNELFSNNPSAMVDDYTDMNIVSRIKPEVFKSHNIERITEHITRFSLGGIQEIRRRNNGHC
ncbi:MAG: hypothetical protein D5R98_05620 [Desulfonatronovibrio sp. MSAO_Bac4]|nr:MAG: hypothetical protein D5R98_05620 [Desulfonatronovibrio sp. MSAO_Bac4]